MLFCSIMNKEERIFRVLEKCNNSLIETDSSSENVPVEKFYQKTTVPEQNDERQSEY